MCSKGRLTGRRHERWTRRDATARDISALTTPLNHSSTGSELASVNSLPPPACITLIFAKRYEINVHLFLLLLFLARPSSIQPSRASYGSRKRIDNGRGRYTNADGYTKIVYPLEKATGSSRCRYPVYVRSTISLLRELRVKPLQSRERLSLSLTLFLIVSPSLLTSTSTLSKLS